MQTSDFLKEEILKILNDLNLSEEEFKHIDIYTKNLIKKYKPLIEAHEKVLEDKNLIELFKNSLINQEKGEDNV